MLDRPLNAVHHHTRERETPVVCARTSSCVSSNAPMPCSARKLGSVTTTSCDAAVNAFSVSTPRLGGQSISTMSYPATR